MHRQEKRRLEREREKGGKVMPESEGPQPEQVVAGEQINVQDVINFLGQKEFVILQLSKRIADLTAENATLKAKK
jgi:hypothetical protein